MPAVTALAVTAGVGAGAAALLLATPRLIAALVSRVVRHVLADDDLVKQVQRKAVEVEFGEWGTNIVKQGGLRCFREMIHDTQFRADMQRVIIASLEDDQFRLDVSHALLSLLRTSLKLGMGDEDLKELIMTMVRATLSDDKLTGFMKGTLKGALKDRELHEATLNGAVDALKKSLTSLPGHLQGQLSEPIESPDPSGANRAQQVQDAINALRDFLASFAEGRRQAQLHGELAEPLESPDPSGANPTQQIQEGINAWREFLTTSFIEARRQGFVSPEEREDGARPSDERPHPPEQASLLEWPIHATCKASVAAA